MGVPAQANVSRSGRAMLRRDANATLLVHYALFAILCVFALNPSQGSSGREKRYAEALRVRRSQRKS